MTALGIDAFLFQHRLAVAARAWSPVWDIDVIEDVLPSPSKHSTAYVVGSHWLDSSYRVYLSGHGIFPQLAYLETPATDPYYPRDLHAKWGGPWFTFGDSQASVIFDERDGRFYREWTEGPQIQPVKKREALPMSHLE
jgi:hypothetical protein